MKDNNTKNYTWLIIVAALLVLIVAGFFVFRAKLSQQPQQSNDTNFDNEIVGAQETVTANPEEVFGYDAEPDGVARVEGDVAAEKAPMREDAVKSADASNGQAALTGADAAGAGGADKSAAAGGYTSPIDFVQLKAQNPDIIGWLSIPGTNISYPVCQNPENDAYYLNHNSERKPDVNGAIFTEATYNTNDFQDPVTVVYGHNMKSGRMFGYLEETFRDGLDGHGEAIVYYPTGEIHYQLFAALRFPSRHILDGRNMYKQPVFENFASNVTGNKDLYSVIDHSVKIVPGDRLLVLSTCVGGDPNQRYIVVGKRVRENSINSNRRVAQARS